MFEDEDALGNISFAPQSPCNSPSMTLNSPNPLEEHPVMNIQITSSKQIKLDVGGYRFTTTITTLTADPNSMLAAMFSGRFPVEKNDEGFVFIDRDGQYFSHILNWLRNGTLPPIESHLEREYLLVESKYYQISSLNDFLLAQDHTTGSPSQSDSHNCNDTRFSLKELLMLVNSVPMGKKLQLPSADLRGLTLDGICLPGANLKYAKMDNASLQYANLQEIAAQSAVLNHAGIYFYFSPSVSITLFLCLCL